MTTVLTRWGNSLAVRLPKEVLSEALFSENDKVELIADKTGIKIQKAEKIETLADLFKGYTGDYQYQESDTGAPVGNEVW